MTDDRGKPVKCDYCKNPPVQCTTVAQGEKPEDPKKENTTSDHRRVLVVRVCRDHLDRLPRPGT